MCIYNLREVIKILVGGKGKGMSRGMAWEKGGKSLLINLSLELFALLLGSLHQLIRNLLFREVILRIVDEDHLVILKGAARCVSVSALGVGWWEDGVDGYFDGIFDHGWYDPAEDVSIDLQTGIGVGLDEEGVQFIVEHEIQPENLLYSRLTSKVNYL